MTWKELRIETDLSDHIVNRFSYILEIEKMLSNNVRYLSRDFLASKNYKDSVMNLKTNKTDMMTMALKGICGTLPYIGSLVSEVVEHLIPEQRIDRVVKFLGVLDQRLKSVENDFRNVFAT